MTTVVCDVATFLTSRAFAINFIANLGGVLVGILLALGIERRNARRHAKMLYGRLLQTSRSELAYLKPMFESRSNSLRDGKSAGTLDLGGVPATRALLISPLVHEQAPYSLIMALTILCAYLDATESAFREARPLTIQGGVAPQQLSKMLGDELDNTTRIIAIALEQIDSQLKLLRVEKTPDAATQEVSRRLREVLQAENSV